MPFARIFLLGWLLLSGSAFSAPRSLYRFDPYLDGAIIAGGALGTLTAYLKADAWTHKRCPCGANEVNGFDRGAIGNDSRFGRTSSDLLVGLAVAAPVALDYLDVGWSEELLEDSVIFAETLAVNSTLVTLVKFTVQRPIPLAYSGQLAQSAEGYHSFYSGHVSTAVSALSAAAFTFNLRHPSGLWPWLGVAALGSAVAVGRVTGGNHFFSDVIVGGMVGAGVGILVPWLHRVDSPLAKVTLAPLGDGGAKLLWSAKF